MTAKQSVLVLAVAALLAIDAPVQAQQEQQGDSAQTNQATQQGETRQTVRIEQLLSNPEQYVGKPVTVVGEVDAIFGSQTFLIENETAGPDPTLLVLSLVPYWQVVGPMNTFTKVELKGQLHQYTREDFERIYGSVSVPDTRLLDRPIFLIGIEEHKQAMRDADSATKPTGQAAPSSVTMTIYDVSLDTVLAHPEKYYGNRVRVSGEVSDIASTHAFVIEDNDLIADDDMLVVSLVPLSQILPQLAEDEEITVTGVVHRLTEGEFQWKRDQFALEEDRWNDFVGRTVLVIGMDEANKAARR